MNNEATVYFIKAQSWFFLSVLVCVLLMPQGITANEGISYYSARLLTVLPYSAGMLGAAWYSLKISGIMSSMDKEALTYWFRGLALLALLVVLVPFTISPSIEFLHIVLSALLFIAELLFMLFIALAVQRDKGNTLLLLLGVTAMLVTLSYLNPVKGYLIFGELAFQVIFAATIYRLLSTMNYKSVARKVG